MDRQPTGAPRAPIPVHYSFLLLSIAAGPLPNVGKVNLLEICRKMAGRLPGGRIISEHSGVCSFGEFGTAVARGDSPRYFQVWVLSNNREFILVTHTCDTEPDPNEISEANEIVMMTTCK